MYIYNVTTTQICNHLLDKMIYCTPPLVIRNEITREKIVWTWKDYYFLGCSHHFFISIDISFLLQGPPSWGEAWHSRLGAVFWTTASGMMSSSAGTTPKLPWWWTDSRPTLRPMDFSTGLTLTKRSGTSGYGDISWDNTVKCCWSLT